VTAGVMETEEAHSSGRVGEGHVFNRWARCISPQYPDALFHHIISYLPLCSVVDIHE